MREIVFITSHPMKAEELSLHLNYPVIHQTLDLPEIQSLDPHEIVRIKAQAAYRQLKRPVLVEDFSLRFAVLGRLPGPLIKWFLAELRPEGLCHLLDSYENRRATAQTCFALCDQKGVHIFDGAVEGAIAVTPHGTAGFGTDCIFIPGGQQKTWSEMTQEEQIKTSVRRIGLKKLERYLHADSDDELYACTD